MPEIQPLTPYLIVSDATAAIKFYQKAFGAELLGQPHIMPGTDKIMHAQLMINGSLIMLCDDLGPRMGGTSASPEALGGTPVTLALELKDARSFFARAVAAGATVKMPLQDMFWGARYGEVFDPFGHRWSMSQTLVQMSDSEQQHAAEQTLAETGSLSGERLQ